MNKLTKVGCSALCGSLAAISAANAGELSVTGGADMTFSSVSRSTTGNPIGIGSNFTINGSSELDNGWAYDLAIAHTNAGAYSAATINIDMQGLGKLTFDQGSSANGIQAFDDKMPTAWEESWGNGLSTGVRLVSGSGTSDNIMYTSPTLIGTTLTLTLAPEYGSTDTGDKSSGVANNNNKRSYDATINVNPSLGTEILSGLNVFVGASTIEMQEANPTDNADQYQAVAGLTYSLGPLSIGLQTNGEYTGIDDNGDGEATTGSNVYQAIAYGIAFNVNDDLSFSYNTYEEKKKGRIQSAGGTDEALRFINVESFQVAYTMGGASVRIADTAVDNAAYGQNANDDKSATIVSLGLAF
jgi:hypothetical protein